MLFDLVSILENTEIDGDVSDTNTKVYGDDSAIFKTNS